MKLTQVVQHAVPPPRASVAGVYAESCKLADFVALCILPQGLHHSTSQHLQMVITNMFTSSQCKWPHS